MSREQRQIEHIHRLLDRTRSMTRLMTDDQFLTINVSELLGAMAEGGEEWDLEQQRPDRPPLTPEMEAQGQHWIYMRGTNRWEVMGTGVLKQGQEPSPAPVIVTRAEVEQATGIPTDSTTIKALRRKAEGWGVCPECQQGKHGNCDGGALNSEDEIDLCACEVAKHRD